MIYVEENLVLQLLGLNPYLYSYLSTGRLYDLVLSKKFLLILYMDYFLEILLIILIGYEINIRASPDRILLYHIINGLCITIAQNSGFKSLNSIQIMSLINSIRAKLKITNSIDHTINQLISQISKALERVSAKCDCRFKSMNIPFQRKKANTLQFICNITVYNISKKRNSMPKKIFIDNIDSSIGQHLYQQLRNDHIDINDYSQIYGSVSNSSAADGFLRWHYTSNQNLTLKTALQCDIVILDLVYPTEFTEIIIRYIKTIHHQKSITVIGLSQFTTWANSRKTLKIANSDPLQALKQKCDFEAFSALSYSHRAPLHNFVYHYELQNLLLSLNHTKGVFSTVICRGLLYGNDYSQMQQIFSKLLTYRQSVICYGQGHNLIPLIHVEDFCRMIAVLVENLEGNSIEKFYFAVDDSYTTQLQLLSCFCQQIGLFSQNKIGYITNNLQQNLYSCNLKLKRNAFLDSIQWKCRDGILSQRQKILEQFILNYKYQVTKMMIIGNNPSLKNNCETAIKEEFGDKPFISQQTLIQYIKSVEQNREKDEQLAVCIENNICVDNKKKPEDIQQQYSSVILEKTLQILIQKQKHIGYILSLADNFDIKTDLIPNDTVMIQCDTRQFNKTQDIKPQAQKNRNKTQMVASSKNLTDKYRVILYESKQYKKLFSRRQSLCNAPTPYQDSEQQQDQRESKQSLRSDSSHKDTQIDLQNKQKSAKGIKRQFSKLNEMKSRLSIINDGSLFSTSMKQYLIDTIIPAVIGGIYQVQESSPQDISGCFIDYLKREAQRQKKDCQTKISFKLKSHKLISTPDGSPAQ